MEKCAGSTAHSANYSISCVKPFAATRYRVQSGYIQDVTLEMERN